MLTAYSVGHLWGALAFHALNVLQVSRNLHTTHCYGTALCTKASVVFSRSRCLDAMELISTQSPSCLCRHPTSEVQLDSSVKKLLSQDGQKC